MDAFERYNSSGPTEEEWIRREQDHERTMERRLQEQDNAAEYAAKAEAPLTSVPIYGSVWV